MAQNKTNYEKYLESEKWKKTRIRIAQQRNYTCEICSKVVYGRFNIHHRTYAHLGNELDDELMFLCENCHTELHIALRAKENNKTKKKEERKTCSNCYYSQIMEYTGKTRKKVLWCNMKYCEAKNNICSKYRRSEEKFLPTQSKNKKRRKKAGKKK